MKCSKCGARANSIAAMAKHYRKAHPKSMKRKTGAKKKKVAKGYCHACGRKR